MKSNLEKAKSLLESGGYTCVLSGTDKIYSSKKRGVLPLLEFLDSSEDFTGLSAADKVVGNGAAFLYVLLRVKEVYAGVISDAAVKTLEKSSIDVIYEVKVKNIINREGNGICPAEQAVSGITNPEDALVAIKRRFNYGGKINDI